MRPLTTLDAAFVHLESAATPMHVPGTRVLTYTPLSIPYRGLALNVTVYSYAGRLYFGLTAARDVVPDVSALARCVVGELRDLRRARAPRPARRRTG